uniref:Uncharacterized protein n=2 Tax=Triticum urartu TaxID=4572 RepID=A0A8R7VGR9_TRIUA
SIPCPPPPTYFLPRDLSDPFTNHIQPEAASSFLAFESEEPLRRAPPLPDLPHTTPDTGGLQQQLPHPRLPSTSTLVVSGPALETPSPRQVPRRRAPPWSRGAPARCLLPDAPCLCRLQHPAGERNRRSCFVPSPSSISRPLHLSCVSPPSLFVCRMSPTAGIELPRRVRGGSIRPRRSPSLARISFRRILAIRSSGTCAASFSFARAPPRRKTPSRAWIRPSPPPPCVPRVDVDPCPT